MPPVRRSEHHAREPAATLEKLPRDRIAPAARARCLDSDRGARYAKTMTRHLLLSASVLALVASTGCSSSSTASGTAQDSGTATATDSSAPEDSGSPGTDSGTTGGDTGTTNPGDGSMPLACAPATDAGTYASVTYVPATKGTNQCASTDIAAFVTACVTSTNQADCPNWFAANVAGQAADGGGAGTTCGNCIAPMNNNGGASIDPMGYVNPNYAGCIQLTDPTSGPACAAACFCRISSTSSSLCILIKHNFSNTSILMREIISINISYPSR